ncbi:uncharacterized protein LOC143300509 [Babylonia areolata]|uniref:uncharacterized protein LOC143300509 n=1 Tax=Babylonia areolata TaxID=304850 RepID=UPI003FCF862E
MELLQSEKKREKLDLLQSEKKREKLADEGYMYLVDKRSTFDPSVCYWRCEFYRGREIRCSARLHTKNGQIVKRMGKHVHEPNFYRVQALKLVQEIKDRALVSNEGTREVIAAVQANVSKEVLAAMPSTASLCRSVQREKQARQRAPRGMLPMSAAHPSDWQQWEGDGGHKARHVSDPELSQGEADPKDSGDPGFEFEVLKEEVMEHVEEDEEKPVPVQGPILEIHTAKLTGAGMWTYREVSQRADYVSTRTAFSDNVLGHWTVAGHGVNQVTQLIQYDSLSHLLKVQQEMENSSVWRELHQPLDSGIVSSDSVLTVLDPTTRMDCQFESSEKAVYELQVFPEQSCLVMLGSKAILVGRFLSLYGPSRTEYRLLRYPDADAAFAAAYHSLHSLPAGTERRVLVPLSTSMLH